MIKIWPFNVDIMADKMHPSEAFVEVEGCKWDNMFRISKNLKDFFILLCQGLCKNFKIYVIFKSFKSIYKFFFILALKNMH